MNITLETYPKILSIQNTSVDTITISFHISRTKLMGLYSVWKRRLIRSLVVALLLAIPHCIHIEGPFFTYVKAETNIQHHTIILNND